jgi:hypothetical protein
MSPATWTGRERLSVVPSPSCPSLLRPHAQTEPSLQRFALLPVLPYKGRL